jgi:hypothetical protein
MTFRCILGGKIRVKEHCFLSHLSSRHVNDILWIICSMDSRLQERLLSSNLLGVTVRADHIQFDRVYSAKETSCSSYVHKVIQLTTEAVNLSFVMKVFFREHPWNCENGVQSFWKTPCLTHNEIWYGWRVCPRFTRSISIAKLTIPLSKVWISSGKWIFSLP